MGMANTLIFSMATRGTRKVVEGFKRVSRGAVVFAKVGAKATRAAFTKQKNSIRNVENMTQAASIATTQFALALGSAGAAAAIAGQKIEKYLGNALKLSGAYETALTTLKFQTSATTDEIKKYDKFATKIGSHTMHTAKDAVVMWTRIATGAGLAARESKNAVKDTLNYVTAAYGSVDSEIAARLSAAMIKKLGLNMNVLKRNADGTKTTVTELGRAYDKIAAATKYTGLDFKHLPVVLNSARQSIKALNMPMEQFLAVTGMLKSSGLTAAESGNLIVQAMRRVDVWGKKIVKAKYYKPGSQRAKRRMAFVNEIFGDTASFKRAITNAKGQAKNVIEVMALVTKEAKIKGAEMGWNTFDVESRIAGILGTSNMKSFALALNNNITTIDKDIYKVNEWGDRVNKFGEALKNGEKGVILFAKGTYKGIKGVRALTAEIADSKGLMAEAAKIQRNTYEGSVKLLKGVKDIWGKTVGDIVKGPMRVLNNAMTVIYRAATKFAGDDIGKYVVKIGVLAAGAGSQLLQLAGKLTIAVAGMIYLRTQMAVATAGIMSAEAPKGIMKVAKAAIIASRNGGRLTGVFRGLGVVLKSLGKSLLKGGAVLAGLALIGAVAVKIYNSFVNLKVAARLAATSMARGFTNVSNSIAKTLVSYKKFISETNKQRKKEQRVSLVAQVLSTERKMLSSASLFQVFSSKSVDNITKQIKALKIKDSVLLKNLRVIKQIQSVEQEDGTFKTRIVDKYVNKYSPISGSSATIDKSGRKTITETRVGNSLLDAQAGQFFRMAEKSDIYVRSDTTRKFKDDYKGLYGKKREATAAVFPAERYTYDKTTSRFLHKSASLNPKQFEAYRLSVRDSHKALAKIQKESGLVLSSASNTLITNREKLTETIKKQSDFLSNWNIKVENMDKYVITLAKAGIVLDETTLRTQKQLESILSLIILHSGETAGGKKSNFVDIRTDKQGKFYSEATEVTPGGIPKREADLWRYIGLTPKKVNKAAGGNVNRMRPTIVGENGPELMFSNTNGAVVNTRDFKGLLNKQSSQNNLNISIDSVPHGTTIADIKNTVQDILGSKNIPFNDFFKDVNVVAAR